MAEKKKGLGRGLDALFPDRSVDINRELDSQNKTEIKEINQSENLKSELYVKISSVEPNRNQPRKQFNEDALKELAESIKLYGVIQPLLVSNRGEYYEIIAGERRWRAAKIAGIREIPIIIKELSDQEKVEVSLIENIQREDLNPIEEAKAFQRLADEFHLTQEDIGNKLACSRTAITNSLRLLKLDSQVQQMLIDEMLTAGHARALLSIEDPEMQNKIAMQVYDNKLSVRETERIVKKITNPSLKKESDKDVTEDAIYESLEEKMKGIMGTRVMIQRKKNNKGKIEIEYYSKEELERIIDLFDSIHQNLN